MINILQHHRSFASMKRMYNRIFRFYGLIEKGLGPKIDAIVREKIATIPGIGSCTALEYACGSGLLSLKLAPLFKSVTARDQSARMLERARRRARDAGVTVAFLEGNILAIDDPERSYDYVFVSFALHLFPPDVVKSILSNLLSIARASVIIIDHGRTWGLPVALIEWLEGGYYGQFITLDFKAMAREIGCTAFEETQMEECTVLRFSKTA